MLNDLIDQNIIEISGDTYKIKKTQGYTLTEDSQIEKVTLMVPETQNTAHQTSFTTVFRERKNHQNLGHL